MVFHKWFLTIMALVWLTPLWTYAQNDQAPVLYQTPPFLKAGDTVAIVAPAGILNNRETEILKGKALMEAWGLNVVMGDYLFEKDNHFAGHDSLRTKDFQNMLNDPKIKAIWCARGGYGSVRILDQLDFKHFKSHPKWIVGYSDITAIHSTVHNLGYQSLHAMMCTSLSEPPEAIASAVATLKASLFGEALNYQLPPHDDNRTGSASGALIGGNLTLLHTMLGSSTQMDTHGKILFIEEIGEYKYHIDRMLQSLKRAGYFDHLNGLIVGDFSNLKKNTTSWGSSIEHLILDVVQEYDFPVLFGFPAGHEPDNRALLLGRTVNLEVKASGSSVSFE